MDQCRSVGLTDCLKVGDDNEANRRPLALSVQCSRQCWKFVCVCASPRLGIGHAGDACTPSASLGASLAHFSSTLFLFPFYSLTQLNSDGVSSGKIFNEWRTTHSSLEGTNRKLTQPVRTVCVCVASALRTTESEDNGSCSSLNPLYNIGPPLIDITITIIIIISFTVGQTESPLSAQAE